MEEALDSITWRVHLGRGFGTVVRHTAKWMNVCRAQFEKLDLNRREILTIILRAVYTWVFESACH
jgi:hypothetical protein